MIRRWTARALEKLSGRLISSIVAPARASFSAASSVDFLVSSSQVSKKNSFYEPDSGRALLKIKAVVIVGDWFCR